MAEAYRISVRKSLLALLLAYLREGIVDVSNFPNYPVEQNIWTFTHAGNVLFLTYTETGHETRAVTFEQSAPVTPGITIEFGHEIADSSQDLPQRYTLAVKFRIQVPWEWVNQNVLFELQQLVDNALQACYGKIQIIDFSQDPPNGYPEYLENQSTERGNWEDEYPTKLLSDLALVCNFQYEMPASVYGGNTPATALIDNHSVPQLPLDKGGTEADLSATGPGFVVQDEAGAPLSILDYYLDGTLYFVKADGTYGIPAGGGASPENVVTVTGDYAAQADDVVLCNSTGGPIQVTIPSAAGNANKKITVKKISSDGNLITLARTGSDSLEFDTALTFDGQGVVVTLISNGLTSWSII